jgi:hypothetical protein
MSDGEPVPSPDLEAALQSERLLAELSARFVNLPADQVDREIETAQRRICEALDIDRSVLFQVARRNSWVSNRPRWRRAWPSSASSGRGKHRNGWPCTRTRIWAMCP